MPFDSSRTVKIASPRPDRRAGRSASPAPSPSPEGGAPLRPTDTGETATERFSNHTRRFYAADWKHYCAWCRRNGLAALPPVPKAVARYLAACASGEADGRPLARSTIERRLCGLVWNAARRGHTLDRADPHIVRALAETRSKGRSDSPRRRQMLGTDDLLAMLGTLPHDLRGLRDRAILLIGFAGALRRSQIVGLDIGRAGPDALGAVAIVPEGITLTLYDADGEDRIIIGRGNSEATCPVNAVERWIRFARIEDGPLFRRIGRDGRTVAGTRLADKHVARLVRQTARAAGFEIGRADDGRTGAFGADPLRAGRALLAAARHRSPLHFNLTRALGL